MYTGSITDVTGLRVGHATNPEARTGVTAILFDNGAVAGVDVRGGGPGTRETDALAPGRLVEKIDAVVLTGGSAFGLDAASGAMRWLEKQGRGYDTGFARVPIVPAAVLFDLNCGSSAVRPDAEMGWAACEAAAMRMTGTPLVLAKRSSAEAHSRTWAMEPALDSTSSVEMVWMESMMMSSGCTSLIWSKMASSEFSQRIMKLSLA